MTYPRYDEEGAKETRFDRVLLFRRDGTIGAAEGCIGTWMTETILNLQLVYNGQTKWIEANRRNTVFTYEAWGDNRDDEPETGSATTKLSAPVAGAFGSTRTP